MLPLASLSLSDKRKSNNIIVTLCSHLLLVYDDDVSLQILGFSATYLVVLLQFRIGETTSGIS